MEIKELIAQTLEHFHIPLRQGAPALLLRFMEELERWNRSINLVGLKDMEGVCRELLADALFLNTYINGMRSIADVGSGSGILAIPIAVLNDGMTVHSVDSNLKKIQFQRHVRRELGLGNLLPLHGRIEAVEPLGIDGVVVKAFGSTEGILAVSGRHLVAGGLVFILKGKDEKGRAYRGFQLEKALSYSLPDVPKAYRLLVYKKIS